MEVRQLARQGKAGHNVLIYGNICYRCSHRWVQRELEEKPKVCPKCKSPYWDRPRSRGGNGR